MFAVVGFLHLLVFSRVSCLMYTCVEWRHLCSVQNGTLQRTNQNPHYISNILFHSFIRFLVQSWNLSQELVTQWIFKRNLLHEEFAKTIPENWENRILFIFLKIANIAKQPTWNSMYQGRSDCSIIQRLWCWKISWNTISDKADLIVVL